MSTPREPRLRALHTSKSFTRLEASPVDSSPRKRASTIQSPGITTVPEAHPGRGLANIDTQVGMSDVFENHDDQHEVEAKEDTDVHEVKLPSTLEDLPVEIRSLTERFLDGLLAKVHPAPMTADQVSQKYQDFYERAAAQINTHIAALISKIGRPQIGSSRASLKGRPRAGSATKRAESPASISGGEMLTPSEVTDRRRARRLLELKRVAMEETVERCVCERIYDRLWKHRSTDDDARDEKLRSKTAALALVGIGLKELHTDSDASSKQARQVATEKEADISTSLQSARRSLQEMDVEKYPLGKLQHLTAAHKGIVETLSTYFPSSSSADEILPTLIYTLITTPPETINVVSNLCYIQRFRAADKVDGEAAYCLVNLEAAIAFLETVDLSSLRADELPQGPPKSSSQPSTPPPGDFPPELTPMTEQSPKPDVSPVEKSSLAPAVTSTQSVTASARPVLQPRSLSSMMQAQANKLETGRENFLSTADRVYDSLAGTLELSLKSVFGRFKDQAAAATSPLPKTLDDARRLISPVQTDEDELSMVSGRSTPSNLEDPLRLWPNTESKALDLIAGRKQLRDRSADSARSGGSGRRVAFAGDGSISATSTSNRLPTPQESLSGAANFITSMNPLNRFGVPSFPRFGRTTPVSPRVSSAVERDFNAEHANSLPPTPAAVDASEDLNAREALAELKKIKPPKKRFLDISSAAELRIGDIEELLREYKRLAKAIGEAVSS
ncbi:hypothetical protein AMS68_000549 [Peltaster fructicola]|uniref:VPS9 domain-containing protein n=1 Tax=Peltaster fructicola TaxID=286661 RepID=A0A6H0XJY3_9PEZI|nr:hypothetical protein AMS68_000549 [Peltaster fructicola]